MKTLYQEIISFDGDYEDLFSKLQLISLFEAIIKKWDAPTAKAIIRYIAYVYSKESEQILGNENWTKIKERCATTAKLPKELWQQIVHLVPVEDADDVPDLIKRTAIKYLNYQNDRNNKDLKSLYDLYEEMITASASPLKDKDGLIDYKMKFSCRDYANQILGWIRSVEERMREEDSGLKAAKQELKEKQRRNGAAIRPEHYAANQ